MDSLTQQSNDYQRIARSLQYVHTHVQHQPDLAEIAAAAGLRPHHFQRLFHRWVGLSPKKFLQFLTKEYALGVLKNSTVLEASYASGLSGPGRLHDLLVQFEAMTPGEFKRQGEGLTITYGFHATPFGECFIAVTPRGICQLSFLDQEPGEYHLQALGKRWRNARLVRNPAGTKKYVEQIFLTKSQHPIRLLCAGTPFQVKVWEAMLRVPPGALATYKRIAAAIGMPKAARAVGNAVGSNPIAYLIPCHRIIQEMATFGGYRWGRVRKQAMLAREAAGL